MGALVPAPPEAGGVLAARGVVTGELAGAVEGALVAFPATPGVGVAGSGVLGAAAAAVDSGAAATGGAGNATSA
ncbi:MAG: MarR family transcriptional regulator, partial [Chloroflexota bacterium]